MVYEFNNKNYDYVLKKRIILFTIKQKEKHYIFYMKAISYLEEKILKNLELANQMGIKIVLRCPIIPTVNDTAEHFKGISDLANRLENVTGIDIEPYHPLGNGTACKAST